MYENSDICFTTYNHNIWGGKKTCCFYVFNLQYILLLLIVSDKTGLFFHIYLKINFELVTNISLKFKMEIILFQGQVLKTYFMIDPRKKVHFS